MMKMLSILAAGAVVLTGLAPAAPAAAQHRERVVVRERTTVVRHDGPRYPHRAQRPRQVCTWKYRNHHRVRVCRTVYR
jgi:Ni/Co efflux regulator RcnB